MVLRRVQMLSDLQQRLYRPTLIHRTITLGHLLQGKAQIKHLAGINLLVRNNKRALAWLEEVFGFRVREAITGVDGQVVHAELTMGDGTIMLGHVSSSARWASPKSTGRGTQFLYVFVDDIDAHFARARAQGAVIVTELETSYGQRRYRALDFEDHEWCFSMAIDP